MQGLRVDHTTGHGSRTQSSNKADLVVSEVSKEEAIPTPRISPGSSSQECPWSLRLRDEGEGEYGGTLQASQ